MLFLFCAQDTNAWYLIVSGNLGYLEYLSTIILLIWINLKLYKTTRWPQTTTRFLKSNSFINILQSFINGYVIIYFFSATLQVSLFHAVWRQQQQQQINKKQRRGLKNESLYNTFVKKQREIHISALRLTSHPFLLSTKKKVNKKG